MCEGGVQVGRTLRVSRVPSTFRLGGDVSPYQYSFVSEMPQRKRLHHVVPPWVENGAVFFVTINASKRGTDVLVRNGVAASLIASASYYHANGIWWLNQFLIMPDHLHALLALPHDKQLGRTITAWKSYQTKTLRIDWQEGFFDHRLRNDESLEEKADYIRMNPVRAGLVAHAEDWPHVWAPTSR